MTSPTRCGWSSAACGELEIDPKRFPPRALQNQISSAKNRLTDSVEFSEAAGSIFEETAADVYRLYEKRMLEANAMDFDDLLVRTVNVMELFEEVRDRWRRAFRHVLVDEYQDTNRAQYRLLQLLAADHGNLMVVGDDAQSVYSFRAADIRNILDFERGLPRGRGDQARAELPLDADDPLRGQRGHRPEPREPAEEALDGDRGRRADPALRADRRARGGPLGRG